MPTGPKNRHPHHLYSCLCHLISFKPTKISRKSDNSIYLHHINTDLLCSYIIDIVTLLDFSCIGQFLWVSSDKLCVFTAMWNNVMIKTYANCKSKMFVWFPCMQKMALHHLQTEIQISGYAERMYTLQDCWVSFLLWFWVFQKDDKKVFVYSGYLERERERWKTSVLLGLRSMPVWKNKVLHAPDFVSINLLFSWEIQVLRKTTFVTFILGIVYQTLKGFITLTVGALFFSPAGRRGKREANPLSCPVSESPSSFVPWRLSDHQTCGSLHFLSAAVDLLICLITLANVCRLDFSRGAPGLVQAFSLSCCRRGAKSTFSHVLFSHRSSEGRSLQVSDFFRCLWFCSGQRGRDTKATCCVCSRRRLIAFCREP